MMRPATFRQAILRWFDQAGRKHLPWQQQRTPYRVWLSEIMLQQTQVNTVIPYFERFILKFPTVEALAQANEEKVLHLWSGLGYYARARHLHKAAKIIVAKLGGKFPASQTALQTLPGIGRSTAAAILAMAFHQRAAILDGNVKRLFSRLFLIHPWQDEAALWTLAEQLAPAKRIADYTQALMDLGALICTRTRPMCHACPLTRYCLAFQQQRQQEFPGKKPRKPLPIRSTQLLMLYDAKGRILLEKRPSKGIWGGLWSLPELASEMSLSAAYCRQHFACRILQKQSLPTFRHTFTHFHLDMLPIRLSVELTHGKTLVASSSDAKSRRWLSPAQLQKIGLPAPIKKLLCKTS